MSRQNVLVAYRYLQLYTILNSPSRSKLDIGAV